MLEKSCQWWLIWYLLFFCHGGAEGQLQCVVKEKVTDYGQDLTLFCPVENCCSEPAGWFVGDKTIIIDVKTFSNDPSVKYHGTYNTDGFGVVIRNLSEADLNVTYRCVYGFDQSTSIHLLHGDVFKENVPDKEKEIDTTAAIVVAIVVTMAVIGLIIGIVAYCVCRSKRPSIHITSTDTDVVEGQSHTITCSISSTLPITDITWIKTSATGNKIVIVVGEDGKFSGGTMSDPSLTINNIAKSDEGTYVCNAKHRFGTAASKDSVLTCKGTNEKMEVVYNSNNQMENQRDEVDEPSVTDPLLPTTPVDSNPRQSSDEAVSLPKEVNNFFHLFYLCQKIATQAVRILFDSKLSGYTLESFLKEHMSVLTSTVDPYQKAKLFPDGQVVVSTDFDFTLLYKLIRNLFTTIPAPTRGWGKQPLSGDLNEGDDIERIRYLRNVLAHSTELQICDADFWTQWTDLSQAIARLSKNSLSPDVESMRTKSFDKCIKNKIEEDIRKEQKQMRKDFEEIQEQVDANTQNIADIKQDTAENKNDIADIMKNITDNKPSIADNKQEIPNSNTRHTQSKLPDKVLSYVASKLGSDWTQVVIELGITQPEIEQIKMDNQGRSIDQITKALFKWRNRQYNRTQDTIAQLIKALEAQGRRDIIDDLREQHAIY